MQLLFDVIRTLSKEEKRLYTTHHRDSNFIKIYEGYVKATHFSKELDQKLYQSHFSEVSRAYYSMQKKDLLNDLLSVLLEYSNPDNSGYNFIRNYSKAFILEQRKMNDGAVLYLNEAKTSAQETENIQLTQQTLATMKRLLGKSDSPNLEKFEQILEEEKTSEGIINQNRDKEDLELAVQMLLKSKDSLDFDGLSFKASEYAIKIESQLNEIEDKLSPIYLKWFLLLISCKSLSPKRDELHREIHDFYNLICKKSDYNEGNRLKILSELLKSAIKVGDFLLLSSLIYKTEKEIGNYSSEVYRSFFQVFYECAALYHFYENDMPTALQQIKKVVDLSRDDTETAVRCIIYRCAMLVAADLYHHIEGVLSEYEQQFPYIYEIPSIALCQLLDLFNQPNMMHANITEKLKKLKTNGLDSTVYQMLLEFSQNKRMSPVYIPVIPPHMEQILRIDLWLKAKFESNFYYNLIIEEWIKRRKVF